jgi:hypothetical protein
MLLYLIVYILQVVSLLLDIGSVDLDTRNLEGDTMSYIAKCQARAHADN